RHHPRGGSQSRCWRGADSRVRGPEPRSPLPRDAPAVGPRSLRRRTRFMKLKRPALQAIGAAEARLAASRRKTRDGLHRARAAFRASLTRPSTLVLAAGAAGVAGLWLARRPRRRRAVHSKAGMGAVVAAYA